MEKETETLIALEEAIPPAALRPQHIAIIMDGNGRWAEARGLPRTAGHKAGVDALHRIVSSAIEFNIPAITVFAFSSENWARPRHEVQFLLELIATVLQREVDRLHKENIRIRVIGSRERFSTRIQTLIAEAEQKTVNNTGLQLIVAANYGGHWDITQATQKIAEKILAKELTVAEITETEIHNALCLADVAPPDFLIRTSGEQRLSNFLLWQLAYTELHFTDVLWPEFSRADFIKALQVYAMRQRRYGMTSEQASSSKRA